MSIPQLYYPEVDSKSKYNEIIEDSVKQYDLLKTEEIRKNLSEINLIKLTLSAALSRTKTQHHNSANRAKTCYGQILTIIHKADDRVEYEMYWRQIATVVGKTLLSVLPEMRTRVALDRAILNEKYIGNP